MIRKYTYGTPINTEAVISQEVKESDKRTITEFFHISEAAENGSDILILNIVMDKDAIDYGLDEYLR